MDRTGDARMRPQKSKSPAFDRNQRKMAMRRPDQETEEFMRFIREFQMEKQPTEMRLQKRAPLPGIGKTVNCDIRDPVLLDKLNGNTLDNDIPIVNRSRDPRNDPVLREILMLGKSSNQLMFNSRCSYNGSTDFGILSRQGNDLTNKNRKQKRHKELKSNNFPKSQLPPLQVEDLPDRPSAPSPTTTPPLPDSDSCSSEERVEWLDL